MVATPIRPASKGWLESIWTAYLGQLKRRPLQSKVIHAFPIAQLTTFVLHETIGAVGAGSNIRCHLVNF